ncbi:MAG: septum formation protein Maf [Gammaproteobacteria bacterium]|nr:septum formation protein Maf [Gammaproteobacteria bacterium]
MRKLILASSSPYRRGLLERVVSQFEVASPDIDEQPHEGESPRQMSLRLAREKSAHTGRRHALDNEIVIGCDQVAALEQRPLGKPGNAANARAQLLKCSGKQVIFYTAVCLRSSGQEKCHVDETVVTFRELTPAEIDAYISREQPFDCAGSFKAEGLGITLFNSIRSEDPTALIGLPLIWLCSALREMDYPLL